MKKIILVAFSIYFTIHPAFSANPNRLVKKEESREIYYDAINDKYEFSEKIKSNDTDNKVYYVKIRKDELDLLRAQALTTKSIVDRLNDLEKLFKNLKDIIGGITATVDIIRKILNIPDAPPANSPNQSSNKVELPSGMILSPGYISFKAKTYDLSKTFSALELKTLDFDVYYNKNLFTIDHIEGDGIYGNQFKFISLPQSSSTAKDRIQVPISAALDKEVKFEIYFVPRNVDLAKVGDMSEIEVKDYKRQTKDLNGNYISFIVYELGLDSPDFIKITKK